MNINPNNVFVVTGILADDPDIFVNKDGSKRVHMKVISHHGDAICLSGLIAKNMKTLGPYQYMKKDQMVQVAYHIKTITDPSDSLDFQIDYIQFDSVINTEKDVIKKMIDDHRIINTEKDEHIQTPSLLLSHQDTDTLMQTLYEMAF